MIDIIFALVILLAIVKGYQKGLVIALFSIIAFILGLAAALKLSAVVAVYLGKATSVSEKWLPVVSFVLVFVIVIFLVNLGAKLIEKTFEMALLGWLNRLGGVLLYIFLYTLFFSLFLFYADRLELFERSTIAASKVYPYVQPLGPKVIDGLGVLVPIFKDMFLQLETFFEGVSDKMQH